MAPTAYMGWRAVLVFIMETVPSPPEAIEANGSGGRWCELANCAVDLV